ncbi:MAG: hypothetical protein ACI9IL_001003, partial [Rickettsiales bacterium]
MQFFKMNIASAYYYIRNTLSTSLPELSLFFTKKSFNAISLFLLLFLFSCSDKSCIEANDFGEYETEYLTVNSGVDLNCSFGIRQPLENDGKNPDLYYEVSESFKIMPYSVKALTDYEDIDKFFNIIATEYNNFLLNEDGINSIPGEKYTNFFTMFDGEIAGKSEMPDFIRGEEREDILIYQRDRTMIEVDPETSAVNGVVESPPQINHRDMVKFLYGGDLEMCNGKICAFTPNIIDEYKWVSKNGTDNIVLGCIMEQYRGNSVVTNYPGSGDADADTNKDINNLDDKNNIKIKYPPTSVFLECITNAIRACNAKKIKTYLTNQSTYLSNNRISRAEWSKTSQYDEEINDALRITTEADIYIKASGDVSLGATSTYPDMFAAAYFSSPATNVNLRLQSKDNNNEEFSDWKIFNENLLDISITANWKDDDEYYTMIDPTNEVTRRNSLRKSYNALSRLAIYIDDKDPLPEEDKKISFYPEITAKSLDPEPKITDQGSFAKYVVQDDFAIINIVFDSSANFGDVSIGGDVVVQLPDLDQLITDTHLRVYFNDNRLDLSSITDDLRNIFAEKGDVIRVELLDPTIDEADDSNLFLIALEDIMPLKDDDGNSRAVSINIGNNYISKKIFISGLYSLTSSCNDLQGFVVANNSDIHNDMKERDLASVSDGNKTYLRKNQQVYFTSPEEGSSCDLSLNLEHQRPAFLCKKRDHEFNVSKLFCSGVSEVGCAAPTPPPNQDCSSCNIGD